MPGRPRWLRRALPVVGLSASVAFLGLCVAGGRCAALATETGADAASDSEGPTAAMSETGADDAQPLRYENDRLTGDVVDMSLHAMLMEIGRQGGARVRIEGVADRDVSGRFPGLPLYEGLRRVLGEDNFTLVYSGGSGGQSDTPRLKEIQVFGGGEGPSVTNGRRAEARPAQLRARRCSP